jgi:hypothetical protein
MQRIFILFCLSILTLQLTAQKQDDEYVTDYIPNLIYEDFTYKTSIKSVLLHQDGMFISQPIISMGGGNALRLSFDDVAEEVKDYYYTFIHCNSDWTPTTSLTEMDYIDGFANDRIRDYEFSYNTLVNYVHYEVMLPNQEMQWKLSGNYLLVVYEDNDMENLVFSRRFMVVDNKMVVNSRMEQPTNFNQARTAQEIDFTVNHQGIRVSNPQIEIKIAILQNGRWDNAITGLKPLFVRNEELSYDYQNQIVFKAGKEFRHLNLQTLRINTDKTVRIISDKIDGNVVEMVKESPRANVPYLFENDLNGKYVIGIDYEDEPETEADYAWVHFYLKKTLEIEGGDVYVWGGLSDFQLYSDYKMEYDYATRMYHAKLFLKQGFYNYQYAFVRKDTPKVIDLSEIEGDWYETDNDYLILVYYRPFGSRYDQLVAVQQLNSN